jgi:hypothetical protein
MNTTASSERVPKQPEPRSGPASTQSSEAIPYPARLGGNRALGQPNMPTHSEEGEGAIEGHCNLNDKIKPFCVPHLLVIASIKTEENGDSPLDRMRSFGPIRASR